MALQNGLKMGMSATLEFGGSKWSGTCLKNAIIYRYNGKIMKTNEVPEVIKAELITKMIPVDDGIAEAANAIANMNADKAKQLATMPQSAGTPSDDLGFEEVVVPEINWQSEFEIADARSVDKVNLRELTKALYERFGIYTCYVNKLPTTADISPLTGEVMTVFTCGQATQQFKAAQRTGACYNPKVIKSQINTSRAMRGMEVQLPTSRLTSDQVVGSAYGREVYMPDPLHEMPEEYRHRYNRRFESPHKSALNSSKGKYEDGTDPDEFYAEPPINAKRPIIREFVANKRSMQQLEEISRNKAPEVQEDVNFEDLI